MPAAQPGARTIRFKAFLAASLFPHGASAASSAVRSHSVPDAKNVQLRRGAARSRQIRPRVAANNARSTATSAGGNVTGLPLWTIFASILVRFSRSVDPAPAEADEISEARFTRRLIESTRT